MANNIDSLLLPFQRFGVHLGLERIQKLLADLDNPHEQFPILHVGGTNGKGSVCAYLSCVLSEAGYRVGRYISPHLVDWTERICLNERQISASDFERLLLEIRSTIEPETECPTQFEVLTAAAWLYFARSRVDVAVIEVGLGGRLDATNVCSNPLASIITSIGWEHWQNLGPTIKDIAREKAGILKPGCPAVIGKLPLEAKEVVAAKIEELKCPAIWVEEPAIELSDSQLRRAKYRDIEYPLPLLGEMQLFNSAIAIAAFESMQRQGWQISPSAIQNGMAKTSWPGRLQWTTWKDRSILVDGAHNAPAARALAEYVNAREKPVTWVIGILSTKDHAGIFQALLRPGDRVYAVPVPDHLGTDPEQLALVAKTICPDLNACQTFPELFAALKSALDFDLDRLIVLCGSLYLVGYFLKQK